MPPGLRRPARRRLGFPSRYNTLASSREALRAVPGALKAQFAGAASPLLRLPPLVRLMAVGTPVRPLPDRSHRCNRLAVIRSDGNLWPGPCCSLTRMTPTEVRTRTGGNRLPDQLRLDHLGAEGRRGVAAHDDLFVKRAA